MHRFSELTELFSIVDRFEAHLQREEDVINYSSIHEINAFVEVKEELSEAYNRQLEHLAASKVLQNLTPFEKQYIRKRLAHLKDVISENISFLQKRCEKAQRIASATRQSILKRQRSVVYTQKGKMTSAVKPSYMAASI